MKEYFDEVAKIIFDGHGVLDKYIEDEIMGLFGAVKHETNDGNQDAVDTVGAAIDLRKQFDEILVKWTR